MRHRHDVESSASQHAIGQPRLPATTCRTASPVRGVRRGVRAASVLSLALAACGGGGGGGDVPAAAAADPASVAASATAPVSTPVAAPAAVAVASIDPAGKPVDGLPPLTQGPVRKDTVNSIDAIVDDMKLSNDTTLAGIPSNYGFTSGPGNVVMGASPRGDATPSWWNPNDQRFKRGEWWNTLIPWLVVFDGDGNDAKNTRVELGDLKAWVKSRSSGEWRLVAQGAVEGWNYPKHLTGSDVSAPDFRPHGNGRSIKPAGGNAVFHGWCCGKQPIDAPDVEAVHITVQARLVVDDPSKRDDRADARYLVHVGGDYYPDAGTPIEAFAPAVYNPGLGTSRAKLVRDTWTPISFTTIDVGRVESTGRAITESQLRAAPPPIE